MTIRFGISLTGRGMLAQQEAIERFAQEVRPHVHPV
jgi:hypothetical protein